MEKLRDQCPGWPTVQGSGRAVEQWWRRTSGNLAFMYFATIAVSSSMASWGKVVDMMMSGQTIFFSLVHSELL